VPVASPQAFENIVPTPKAVRPPPPPSSYQAPPAPPTDSEKKKVESSSAKADPSKNRNVEESQKHSSKQKSPLPTERRTIASQQERKRINAMKSSKGIIVSAIVTLILIAAGPPLQSQLREKGSYLNEKLSKVTTGKTSTAIQNASPSLKPLDSKRSMNTLKSFQSIVHPEAPQLSKEKSKVVPKSIDKPTGSNQKSVTTDVSPTRAPTVPTPNNNSPTTKPKDSKAELRVESQSTPANTAESNNAESSKPSLNQGSSNTLPTPDVPVEASPPKSQTKTETKAIPPQTATPPPPPPPPSTPTTTTPASSVDAKKTESATKPATVVVPNESTMPPRSPLEMPKAPESTSQPGQEATKPPEKSRSEAEISVEPLPQAVEALSNAEKYVVQPKPVITDTEITFEDIMKNKQ
jgi:hypothetical protein